MPITLIRKHGQRLDLTGTAEPHSWSIYDYLECFCVPVEVIRQRSRGFDTVKVI
ncbi:hypothetical protein HanHA300_Chr02g0046781 [Helianthus annuus]|nr:hypothetical protein HanHA300_Chr02g0046781 [Helianthus annuus]KAJ0618193.1 hypothetical protein HanHA89_Chr02g0050421 [Helianthus annuus]KAJ0776656.1 hypothetical protein HanLR1_Chr02g0048181 [Helianthus annuus]